MVCRVYLFQKIKQLDYTLLVQIIVAILYQNVLSGLRTIFQLSFFKYLLQYVVHMLTKINRRKLQYRFVIFPILK